MVSFDAWLLAVILSPAIFPLHVLWMRAEGKNSNRVTAIFKVTALLCMAWFLALIELRWKEPIYFADVSAGIFTILFVAFGYAEFYSMIVRGFSLNVLVCVFRHGKLSRSEIDRQYANGKGIQFIQEKRLSDMKHLGLVKERNQTVTLTAPKGQRFGLIFGYYKKLIKISGGGLS